MKKIKLNILGLMLISFLFSMACKNESTSSQSTDSSQRPSIQKSSGSSLEISTATPERNDIEERLKFQLEMRALVYKEEFDRLETIAKEFQTSKARFSGGDWKLSRFYDAISGPEHGEKASEEEWQEYLPHLRKWFSRKPKSVFAKVFLGDALTGYGWKARGSGFAPKVTEEGYILFRKRLDEAEAILRQVNANDRKNCLNWYEAMDRVARGKGWNHDAYDEMFDEAVKLEPQYLDFYLNKAVFLLPRWHGAPGDWEEFAEESAKKIHGEHGEVLYTMICWQVSRFYSGQEFYKQNRVSWPRIKRGFIQWEKLYGPSYRYMNAFCLLAGAASDKRTTKILLERIGDKWEPDFWGDRKFFEGYQKWAGIKK